MKVLKFFIIGSIIIGNTSLKADDNLEAFFQKADAFLQNRVENGMVDYQTISDNFNTIDNLYKEIGNMDLSGATDQEKKAFFINAYNLIVIHAVSKYYPLQSPMDKSGFFDKLEHKVAGEQMTLNYLEIKKLLIPFKDARIHFAVACAAISCPPLANFAYMPDQLDEQLTSRTKKALNDPEFIKVRPANNEVAVSKIFDWYKDDFTQNGQSIIEYLNKYRDEKIPSNYQVTYYEYNWELNKQS